MHYIFFQTFCDSEHCYSVKLFYGISALNRLLYRRCWPRGTFLIFALRLNFCFERSQSACVSVS